jgi:hypothetical protein
MITVPTVLVLGAGASKEFGYPIGEDLLYEVADGLNDENSGFAKHILSLGLHFGEGDVHGFANALRYSGQPSIDAFIERRAEYFSVARPAMALALLGHEDVERPFAKNPNLYKYIYSCMTASNKEEFKKNTLNVVTFNYDMSLEYFMDRALMNSFGLFSPVEAAALRSETMKITHVHGSLAPLVGKGDEFRRYGDPRIVELWKRGETLDPKVVSVDRTRDQFLKFGQDIIRRSADGICIPAPKMPDDYITRYSEAHDLLTKAKRIIFLGFAYEKRNLGRLQNPSSPPESPAETLVDTFRGTLRYGTCLGFTRRQRDALLAASKQTLILGDTNETALDFLRTRDLLNLSVEAEGRDAFEQRADAKT